MQSKHNDSVLLLCTVALLVVGAYGGSQGGLVGALSVPIAMMGAMVIIWCTVFW